MGTDPDGRRAAEEIANCKLKNANCKLGVRGDGRLAVATVEAPLFCYVVAEFHGPAFAAGDSPFSDEE
jgi:hypothetical protein